MFEEFWQAYPRRVGKGAARKAYEKALTLAAHEEIMLGVEAFKKAEPWHGDLQFCPHPSTWLNQERWSDEHTEERRFSDPWDRAKYMDEFKRRKGLQVVK